MEGKITMNSDLQDIIAISKNLKLLYVEDNEQTRVATQELLYSFFDDVVIATDGMEAWEFFQKSHFDIVFTDISMPRMDGIELIDNIRKTDMNISIVVLSAHNDTKYLLQAIKLGVDGYIIKPLELEQFLTILKKVIRKYQLEKNEKETRILYDRIAESIKFASVLQHSL